MSKFEKLNVDIRKEQGTSAARRTRLQNKVPAVVYHSGVEATPLSVDKISLNKALRTGQMIFEVNVEDKDQFVLVKEIQYHPVTDEIIHIDFQKVKEDEKISLEVAVRSSGEAQGVKLGGLLVQMLNSVTIKCRPAEIPEFLEIDVTDMEMNTNLFVRGITLPGDVERLLRKQRVKKQMKHLTQTNSLQKVKLKKRALKKQKMMLETRDNDNFCWSW